MYMGEVLGVDIARVGEHSGVQRGDGVVAVVALVHALGGQREEDLVRLDVHVLQVEGDLAGDVAAAAVGDHLLAHVDQLYVRDLAPVLAVLDRLVDLLVGCHAPHEVCARGLGVHPLVVLVLQLERVVPLERLFVVANALNKQQERVLFLGLLH